MKKHTLLFLFSLSLMALFSCNRETFPDQYTITCQVYTNDTVAAQNVLVRMYAPVGADGLVNRYQYTDASGIATFKYEARAYLVLDARKGSFGGCNYVELNKEENVSQTVYIYPFGTPNGCAN